MAGEPIEGQVLLVAAAKASVPAKRLPDLVDLVQAELASDLESYERRYELAHEAPEFRAFFVEDGHWGEIGDRLGFDRRETDAVRRAHHEQLRSVGRREDRDEEFESALEIRDCVLIGT